MLEAQQSTSRVEWSKHRNAHECEIKWQPYGWNQLRQCACVCKCVCACKRRLKLTLMNQELELLRYGFSSFVCLFTKWRGNWWKSGGWKVVPGRVIKDTGTLTIPAPAVQHRNVLPIPYPCQHSTSLPWSEQIQRIPHMSDHIQAHKERCKVCLDFTSKHISSFLLFHKQRLGWFSLPA